MESTVSVRSLRTDGSSGDEAITAIPPLSELLTVPSARRMAFSNEHAGHEFSQSPAGAYCWDCRKALKIGRG